MDECGIVGTQYANDGIRQQTPNIEMQIKMLLFLFVCKNFSVFCSHPMYMHNSMLSFGSDMGGRRSVVGIRQFMLERERAEKIVNYHSILTNCYTIAKR